MRFKELKPDQLFTFASERDIPGYQGARRRALLSGGDHQRGRLLRLAHLHRRQPAQGGSAQAWPA